VAQGEGDLIITDVVMPDENAFDLLPRIKKLRPELPIIVMSAQNTFMTAIKPRSAGPTSTCQSPSTLRNSSPSSGVPCPARGGRHRTAGAGRGGHPPRWAVGRDAGDLSGLARLMPTDLTVMISGESGTGKELVARALHDYGKRAKARSSP
jgi:two-component system nitrogen regulation response regulator GlnG